MVKGKLSTPKMKSIHSRSASSCQSKVAGKEALKEAISEVCYEVLKTDKDVYICPECHESKKSD
jgi:hypothetical protein